MPIPSPRGWSLHTLHPLVTYLVTQWTQQLQSHWPTLFLTAGKHRLLGERNVIHALTSNISVKHSSTCNIALDWRCLRQRESQVSGWRVSSPSRRCCLRYQRREIDAPAEHLGGHKFMFCSRTFRSCGFSTSREKFTRAKRYTPGRKIVFTPGP